MCELFGLTSAKAVRCNEWLQTFYSHSVRHPHGWGIALLDGEPRIEREPVPAYESARIPALLSEEISCRNMMAHIRLASVGSLTKENCHPFIRTDRWGRTWVLEHNGTIFDGRLLEAYKPQEEGSTDSERILCCLIDRVNNLLTPPTQEERWALAERLIRDIAPQNKINLLFWDSECLYVHTNLQGTLYSRPVDGGHIFATTPLDDGSWRPVPMQRLQVWQDGRLRWQGEPHPYTYFGADSH